MVFDLSTNSAEDHLNNLGSFYTDKGQWRRASAFGLRPFPDKDRESKTWLSEDTGATASIDGLLKHAGYFHLNAAQARQILSEVVSAVGNWRTVDAVPRIKVSVLEPDKFTPAFEPEQMRRSEALVARQAC